MAVLKKKFTTDKLIRARATPVSKSQLNSMLNVIGIKESTNDGWAILENLVKETTGVFEATDKAIADANFQLAGLVRENIRRRIRSGRFYKRLSPLTRAIEENRKKFGSSVAQGLNPIRSNPELEMGRFSAKRRKPLFRTGQMLKSLTVSRAGAEGKGTIAVGFPDTPRRGSSLTNADVARMVESGFQVKIPPSNKGLADIGFPASIADQRSGIRGFMSILAMIGDFAMPFPPTGGVAYRVPPRPMRLPTVQSMTALSGPDSDLAANVYITAFLESVLKRTYGDSSRLSPSMRSTIAELERRNAELMRQRKRR